VIEPQPIATPRLELVPAPRAVIDGDLSTISHVDGWPHADTRDALRLSPAVWLVELAGVVIGECGTAGALDDAGEVEIGYGLAAEKRGLGYGTELVQALSQWLLARPRVSRIVAVVEIGNVPSRRALERAGFALERTAGGRLRYALD
jgi:RimJ/RimL family protein N-acetyltransferase